MVRVVIKMHFSCSCQKILNRNPTSNQNFANFPILNNVGGLQWTTRVPADWYQLDYQCHLNNQPQMKEYLEEKKIIFICNNNIIIIIFLGGG